MKMLIGGKWIDRDKKIEVKNPFNGKTVGVVPQAEINDCETAISTACKGAAEIGKMPLFQRAGILYKTAELLEKQLDKFAISISNEVGKTIKEASGEVTRAIQTLKVASEEAKQIHGETIPFDAAPGIKNRQGFYSRVPLGVILAITPFNFPLNLACHKLAPAIAAGNSVILKPASATPLTDLQLGELFLEAGLPENALSIIT
ncbi:MAG: aldehyde dehydrogenase family protein [Victivallaceae bacterium]|nr:aldehyde dehydrogenase family protein [Victivallaceae bacterium]